MSIEGELKKEHAKLSHKIVEWQQTIEMLESLMKQYGIYQSPSAKSLDDIIERCIQRNGGQATYEQIYTCITKANISVPKHKVSSALTSNKRLAYDKVKKEWHFAQVVNDNHQAEALDLNTHQEQLKHAG